MNLVDLAERIKPCDTRVEKALIPSIEAAWIIACAEQNEQVWRFQNGINMKQGICIHRWKIWWAIPRLILNEYATPAETYMIFCKLENNSKFDQYMVMITTIDHNMGFSLSGIRSPDSLELHGHYNGAGNLHPGLRHAVLLATSEDPFLLLERAIGEIKTRLRSHFSGSMKERLQQITLHAASVPKPKYARGPGPHFVDSLGWCTWDSFYTDLSEDRVLQGLRSFVKTGVRPGFLILDDGWQSTDVDGRMNGYQWGGRLRSFLANFKFAPGYSAEVVGGGAQSGPVSGDEVHRLSATSSSSYAAVAEGVIPGSQGRNLLDGGHSLRGLVERARAEYGVKHLLVWHTLSGYWAGVSPDAPEMSAFSPQLAFPQLPFPVSMQRMSRADALKSEPFTVKGVGVVHQDRLEEFFSAYHATLKAMGVSGVKVDAQSVLPALTGSSDKNRTGGWELVLAAHSALQASLAASFGRTTRALLPDEFPVVHCMCHSLHTLLAVASLYPDENDIGHYSSKIPGNTPYSEAIDREYGWSTSTGASQLRPVVRGSDDYWPKDPASHGPHLYANAMNSLLLVNIGLQDWDMFQSGHGRTSRMHAAARAVSGGPVYVSDTPESHDADILRRLAFPDGAIPRPLRNALPARRLLFTDPQRHAGVPLMIQNFNSVFSGVVAVFNIAGAVLEDDRDCFRFLHPDEMTWPEGFKPHGPFDMTVTCNGVLRRRSVYDEEGPLFSAHEEAMKDAVPNPYLSALGIRSHVMPQDVEELRKLGDGVKYLAYRHTDCSHFLCQNMQSTVPFSLPRVFDYDIVSFSRLFPLQRVVLGASALCPSDLFSNPMLGYVAALGCKDMFNPGGSVLAFSVDMQTTSEGNEVILDVVLLGSGVYSVVVIGTPSGQLRPISNLSAECANLVIPHRVEAVEEAEMTSSDTSSPGEMRRDLDALVWVPISVETTPMTVTWVEPGSSEAEREHSSIYILELQIPSTQRIVDDYQRSRVIVKFTL